MSDREVAVDLSTDSADDGAVSAAAGTGGDPGMAFLEADLRTERAPDEFLAVAASNLGRGYAQRSSTGDAPVASQPAAHRRRTRSPRQRRGRVWPAGAAPDFRFERPRKARTGGTREGAVYVSDDSEAELVCMTESAATTAQGNGHAAAQTQADASKAARGPRSFFVEYLCAVEVGLCRGRSRRGFVQQRIASEL